MEGLHVGVGIDIEVGEGRGRRRGWKKGAAISRRIEERMASLRSYYHPYNYLRKGDRIQETIASESDIVNRVHSGGTSGDAPLGGEVHEDSQIEFFVKDSYWRKSHREASSRMENGCCASFPLVLLRVL